MREQPFRDWLEERRWKGKPLSSISGRISKARRFERAMPALGLGAADLDAAFDTDKMERVTQALRDWCRAAAKTSEAPAELVGETNSAARRINNVAAAVRNYRQFREAGTALASQWPALDELRAAFLERVPEFERFDLTDNGYERVERHYKDAMIAKVREIVASDDDDEQAGRRLYRALMPNDGPLLRWQTDDDFARKFPALAPDFYAAIGRLARDQRPIAEAIMAAADRFAGFHAQGATTLTLGQVAGIAITVAGVAQPNEAAPFKMTKAQELAKLLTGDVIFRGTSLEREQLDRWLDLLRRVEAVMRDRWGWAPRDLVDVQGFAWAALDEGWVMGEEEDDDAVLERFEGSQLFREVQKMWTAEQTAAFCSIARAVHEVGLDWYFTNMADNPVRFGRKPDRAKRARATLGYLNRSRVWLSDKAERPQIGRNDITLDRASAATMSDLFLNLRDRLVSWEASTPTRPGRWPDEAGVDREDDGRSTHVDEGHGVRTNSTNLILHGPPGTGKTYATAIHAVRLCGEIPSKDRKALMKRYKALSEAGRIEFVTFHQSLAYEEFVEGLRPSTDAIVIDGEEVDGAASGGFRLKPRDGIFKQISERARLSTTGEIVRRLDRSRSVFKIALGRRGTQEAQIAEGLSRELIHLGWGGEIDWSDERFDSFEAIKREWQQQVDPGAAGTDPNIVMMFTFRRAMEPGDYVILSDGRDLIRAVGEVTGEYYYDEAATFHPHRRPVQWLWQDADGKPRERFYPRQFRRHSTYELAEEAINWDALDALIYGEAAAGAGEGEPYVLVIDEINRANISKVFGELITLLEDDKRIGCANELRVKLPYSGDIFGVPANLHIIGTMNTADRSIALLDTALRRRFTFEELMPDPALPEIAQASAQCGVDIRKLLETINERIEYLFDREHQIGHAYFFKCKDREALDGVMRHRVIPLLQEYFYEDWAKVAAVLGDATEGDADSKGGFLERARLPSPPGLGDTSDVAPRWRWSVRSPAKGFDYSKLQ